jgi:hypothetical protein
MVRSTAAPPESTRPRRISEAVEQVCATDAEPTVKARMLRELADWYRALAARAANPVIWESRLFTAEDLEAEANRIDPNKTASEQSSGQEETSDEPAPE